MAISTIHFLVTWDAVALLSNGDNHFMDLLLQSLKFSLSTNNNFPPFIAFFRKRKEECWKEIERKFIKWWKEKKKWVFYISMKKQNEIKNIVFLLNTSLNTIVCFTFIKYVFFVFCPPFFRKIDQDYFFRFFFLMCWRLWALFFFLLLFFYCGANFTFFVIKSLHGFFLTNALNANIQLFFYLFRGRFLSIIFYCCCFYFDL